MQRHLSISIDTYVQFIHSAHIHNMCTLSQTQVWLHGPGLSICALELGEIHLWFVGVVIILNAEVEHVQVKNE